MHRPIAQGIVAALIEIFQNQKPADRVVKSAIQRNRRWGGRDRRLFAETVYEIVRWWRRDLWLTGFDWPASDQSPSLTEQEMSRVLAGYVEKAELRLGIESQSAAVRHSIPDWLDRLASEQVEAWSEVIARLNEPAPVFLRANTLKTNVSALRSKLEAAKIKTKPLGADALRLEERANVVNSPFYQDGLFEVQDLHSQRIAPFLLVEPGQSVIDACAGAGGKTLHLAALMANRGRLLALDVSERKLRELQVRSKRAGVRIVEVRRIAADSKFDFAAYADRVLLDVPCSGLGVLRRHPDFKWKLSPEKIKNLKTLQSEILDRYALAVKSGGLLVYSTCSIMKCENQEQVKAFLERQTGRFELEEELHIAPGAGAGDGFYAARLRRLS